MKWIVIATAVIWTGTALFAIQVSSPIPPQVPSNTAHGSQNIKNDADKDESKTTSTPLQDRKTAASDEKQGGNVASDNKQQSIAVGSLPQISVAKDWWDKSYIIFTFLLVLVGGATLGAIWYQAWQTKIAAEATRDAAIATQASAKAVETQVGVMERQTKATEDAAIAAQQGVEIIISKERASLRVDPKDLTLMPVAEMFYTADVIISNDGPTRAVVTEARIAARYLPTDSIDTDVEPIMSPMPSVPRVILPNTSGIESFAFIYFESSPENFLILEEIRADRMFVEIQGFIAYRDIFANNHTTRFRRVWKYNPHTRGDKRIGGWETCGRPEDNKET